MVDLSQPYKIPPTLTPEASEQIKGYCVRAVIAAYWSAPS